MSSDWTSVSVPHVVLLAFALPLFGFITAVAHQGPAPETRGTESIGGKVPHDASASKLTSWTRCRREGLGFLGIWGTASCLFAFAFEGARDLKRDRESFEEELHPRTNEKIEAVKTGLIRFVGNVSDSLLNPFIYRQTT